MAGHIVTVLGAKGGVGKSVLAGNLAFAFSLENRQKTLLLDFDVHSYGDQSVITGMKSPKTLKDLSEFNGAIEPRTLNTFATSHKSGVSYISLPKDPMESSQIEAENLSKFLKAAKQLYPVTVIDGGSEINELLIKALEYSTLVLFVVTPDLLAINQSRKFYSDLLTMLIPKDMIQFVFNKVQKNHPVSPDFASKQIGRTVFSSILRDDSNCALGLSRSSSVLLLNKSAPFSDGLLKLVRRIKSKNVFKTLERLNRPKPKTLQKAVVLNGGGTTKNFHHRENNKWTLLKQRVLRALVEEMDLQNKKIDDDPKSQVILREKTKKKVVEILGKEETRGIVNGRDEMNQLVKEILDEALGLGPLEDLLADNSISEIMVVGPDKIYYEQNGKNKLSDVTFTSDKQVLRVIEKIVYPIGRRIDEKTPYVDARLPDGSRVHAIIPPCAIDGCTITIRKFPENRLSYKDLIKFGTMTQEMADFIRVAVEGKKNVVVSGGTGSGKTTLVNVLGGFIPSNERIITCEDSAELDLPQEHVVRLETRPPNLEGDGEISIRTLVKQTLRMKPDRIIVGECRGGEALDMLQAMNTGHDGSMTTVHSNSPRDAINRLETLVQYAEAGISPKAIKEIIASAIHLIIQQARLEDGSRKIISITEVGGLQGDIVTLQDIFVFKHEGIDNKGKVKGKFQATGFIPKFVEDLEKKGYKIPRGIFKNKD
ncbi:MAG: Flp pilus assembly complex ATPase component TadA [Halobacteriovoraceae bacterium]|nr:Flp pilus assembly complex ATPase component TadA [Halobacteriovoraceae bacterium]